MTTPTVWKNIRFETPAIGDVDQTCWKAHVVPAGMRKLLLDDLQARGAKLLVKPDGFGAAVVSIKEAFFDPGGPVFADAPKLALRLPGIKYGVRCDDLEWLHHILARAEIRWFDHRVRYVKLHTVYHCHVLKLCDRELLMGQLDAGRADAKARAQAFYVKKQHDIATHTKDPKARATIERVVGGRISAALPRDRGRA